MKKFIVHDNNTLDKLIFTKPQSYKEYVLASDAEAVEQLNKEMLEVLKLFVSTMQTEASPEEGEKMLGMLYNLVALEQKAESIIAKAEEE